MAILRQLRIISEELFPKASEDFRRRGPIIADDVRRTLQTLERISSETVNRKKLANLTANTQNYGQITPNIEPHSDPPFRLVRSLELCQVSIRQTEKGTARSLQYNIKIS